MENREIKSEANHHYQAMLTAMEQCDGGSLTDNVDCQTMKEHRIELDKRVQSSAHYDSLTRLFITFAIFLTLIAWGVYFLTRAIFR